MAWASCFNRRTFPHRSAERLYLLAAPIPIVVAFFLPGPIRLTLEGESRGKALGAWLSAVGGWLSLALVIGGILLLGRRWAREEMWDPRLLIGLVVAALPALLIGVVGDDVCRLRAMV